jgi:outer membrane protein TolC
VRLLRDSLQVAQAQYSDISHQHQYGTASRLDKLSSHQEVLNYQRSLSQAQAALAGSLRDLFDLTGTEADADLTAPFDSRAKGNLPVGVAPPTVWIGMDSTEDSQKVLRVESGVPPDDSVPQLKTYSSLAESERFAADSIAVGMLPKITLSAQAGYQDPIGPINETLQQNTLSVTASMPIFDWGQILDDSDSKRKQSQAYLSDLDQAKLDLWRDYHKAQDFLRSIEYQRDLNRAAVEETRELAQLTYASYKAGGSKYLEVQTANFQALNAKVQAVTNDLQMLMQLSVLASLSGDSSQTAAGSSQ